jgi:hypothetical protein
MTEGFDGRTEPRILADNGLPWRWNALLPVSFADQGDGQIDMGRASCSGLGSEANRSGPLFVRGKYGYRGFPFIIGREIANL